ncbi:LysM peptidoglycan-binding domain-containing protein [Aerosakkonemataceae cyanobacterium BLCC-F154]|uniref:LysM peptidoglycan-binding domain-containing protein n=1 Tax=Floridaenema fluviatile BLCC-F154 TaxID=3153640 RepID=A0ABV4YHF2_9CYAN
MTNFQGRLSRESRGYVKTALTTAVKTGIRKWSTSKGVGWLLGKAVSGPMGVALEVFWPTNTIVSGAEEMRMLREYRMRMLQTPHPLEKLPQSIVKFPVTPEPIIRDTYISVKPDFQDRLNLSNHRNYRVHSGDILSKLAPKFGYTNLREFVRDFQRHNPGVNPNHIFVDKTYKMPFITQPGMGGLTSTSGKPSLSDYVGVPTNTTYRVNQGDTLWKLAPQFGYKDIRRFVKDFQTLNPGVDPNRIYAGRNYNMPNKAQFVLPIFP